MFSNSEDLNWIGHFVQWVILYIEALYGEWICGVNFLKFNFKVRWGNGAWTKILYYDFLFTWGNLTLVFTVFISIFFIAFFLSCLYNPFIVHSRSSVLLSERKFFELLVRSCPAVFFLLAYLNIFKEIFGGRYWSNRDWKWSEKAICFAA